MTSLSLVIRPEAQADVAGAVEWYARERLELGIDFALAVQACFNRIREAPEFSPVVHREIRRAFVGRFPYLVFFRVEPSEVIVLAVMHGARRPATWKRRR